MVGGDNLAVLSAIFKAHDEISETFDKIANKGEAMVDQWDKAGSSASEAFERAETGAAKVAQSVEGAATSMDGWTESVGNYDKGALEAIYSTEDLVKMGIKAGESITETAEAAEVAATSMDNWTNSIGDYDKGALDAIYSTEELVEMGFKTEEALTAAEEALTASTEAVEKQSDSLEKGIQYMSEFRGAIEEQEAELYNLQEAYMGVSLIMGKNSDEAIALQAEIDELTETLEENYSELEHLEVQSGRTAESGSDMAKKIENALTAAALTKLLSEVADMAIEMANAFSEAESIIVKATGATGEKLESLSDSMMNVYAVSKNADLSSVAGTVGEINTRLGLMDEELERSTSLFMDYARVTNSNVTGSVQNVTKVMKSWNIENKDTEKLMDKFISGSQKSGAAVDKLSDMVVANKAVLQQMGYSLDESIALMAMFESEGLKSSSVMSGLRSAIKVFSGEGVEAKVALQDVTNEISSMRSESEATALAIKVFGAEAGPEMASSIRAGKFEIDSWVAAIENSEGTLSSTANAATTLEEKWTQASNSMNTAFSSVISPAVDTVSSKFAGFVQGIGDFLNKNKVVTAILVGIATGIVAVTAALAIYKVAITIGTVVTAIFGTTLSTALWPITLVVAGIAALTTGLILLFDWLGNANKEFDGLTATSKQYYEQLEELNAQYDETIELYGENSAKAQELAGEIAALEAVYESSKMTLEELVAQNDKYLESHNKMVEDFHNSMDAFDSEEQSAQTLMVKLEQLNSKTNRTAGEQKQMEAIVSKLNKQYPDLALSIDKTTGVVEQSIDAYRGLAEAQAEEQRIAQQYESYVALLADRSEGEEKLRIATEQRIAAQERYDNADGFDKFWNVGKVKSDLKAMEEEEERLQIALGETNELLGEHEAAFENAAKKAEESAAYDEWAANVETAAENVEVALSKVDEVWNSVYESAYESISGQLGLFNELKDDIEVSVGGLISIWDSHTEYLKEYAANISSASEVFNIDLVNSLSDGSEESAAYLDSMMGKYNELAETYGADSEEIQAYLDEVNNSFTEREAAMEEWSSKVADSSSEVTDALSEAQTAIDEFAESLNISEEAAEYGGDAALQYIESFSGYLEEIQTAFSTGGDYVIELDESETANGYGDSIGSQYANGISGQYDNVKLAAQSLASVVSTTLSGSSVSVTASVSGYAKGTKSAAPGVKLVGEEGPELIDFRGGEVVYTADETNRMLTDFSSPMDVSAPSNFEVEPNEQNKTITIKLDGHGSIVTDGKANESTILDMLVANVKPVFLNILRSEVYEEGDLNYEF